MKKRILLMSITTLIYITGLGQNIDSVINYINTTDIKHKDIVVKQVKLETGNLKCTDCSRDVNNIFGFYYKKQYIKFDSWQDSVDYYSRWQTKWYKEGNYYEFLDCIWKHKDGRCARYAEDKDYTTILKTI